MDLKLNSQDGIEGQTTSIYRVSQKYGIDRLEITAIWFKCLHFQYLENWLTSSLMAICGLFPRYFQTDEAD